MALDIGAQVGDVRVDIMRTITQPSALACLAALLASRPALSQPARVELDLGGVSVPMILVRRGAFTQGSPLDEVGRSPDESQRVVTITRDFYLGEAPVLRGQFARFVSETGYRTEAEVGTSGGSGFDGQRLVQRPEFNWRNPGFAQTDDHPVALVTAADAEGFISWASARAGRVLRLPTEAEWEFACRAGTQTPWYSGATQESALSIGWFRAGSGGGTRAVGGRQPNALGLHDLVGNVHQWTADMYAPYSPAQAIDPLQSAAGSPPGEPARRVLRGGSWLRSLESGRCAARSRNTPGSRNADNGFRLAMDAVATAPVVPAFAPPTPAPSVTDPSADDSSWQSVLAGLCACFFAAFAAPVAWLLYRRSRWTSHALTYNGPYGVKSAQVRTRAQADGFWMLAPSSFDGATFRVMHPNLAPKHESTVVYQWSMSAALLSRGMFVYTGATPRVTQVVCLALAAPTPSRSSARRAHGGHVDDHSGHQHHYDHGSHFDPPAY